MKFSFGCLGAVLAPVVVMANEIEQQPVAASASASASTVIRDNILNSPKDNLRSTSSSSPYSKVKATPAHKHPTHRVAVRHQPNELRNIVLDTEAEGDDEVDIDWKVNEKAAGSTKAASATITATTTAVAASGKEVCIPPVLVSDISKLDSGHLPLSSCSSKKHVCIDVKDQKEPSSSSSPSSIQMKTGYCLEMVWDVPTSYSAIMSPSNEDESSTYWGDSSSTSYAATTYFTHKENDGSKREDNLSIHGEDPYDYSLFGYNLKEDNRHLQSDTSAAPSSLPTSFDCESKCNHNPPPVNVTGSEFKDLVTSCVQDATSNLCNTFGPLVCWDTSLVDNMLLAFFSTTDFNIPLECWDVGQVTTMSRMFLRAYQFNQPLDSWDVSQVGDMSAMFSDADKFNQPLDSWDVSQVVGMSEFFFNTGSFNQPLDLWDVSQVTTMDRMFGKAKSFNQPLDLWDVSKVTTMYRMFYTFYKEPSFNQCLSTWADKTTVLVKTNNMFKGSSCTVKNTVDPNGPWCQTEVDGCNLPTAAPTTSPSADQSGSPSNSPSAGPSESPSESPSSSPSADPSSLPSEFPSSSPSVNPSGSPSKSPSAGPSGSPSESPSSSPSVDPSGLPSSSPSAGPSKSPSKSPSSSPSVDPSGSPSSSPSSEPSSVPSINPSASPSESLSAKPSTSPSSSPSNWHHDHVDLGTAGNFAILTKSGVTTTGTTTIVGHMGTSPIAETALTGFALDRAEEGTHSTSAIVTGFVFAADHGQLTPAMMTTAVHDMEAAYTDAAGRVGPNSVELGAGILSGMTLRPGIYKWSTNVEFTTDLTFDGTSTDVWIMQIAGTFTAGPGASIVLVGEAKGENIYWAIADVVAFDDGSHGEGIFLAQTMISFNAGSSLYGAAFAQTAVTMISTNVVGALDGTDLTSFMDSQESEDSLGI